MKSDDERLYAASMEDKKETERRIREARWEKAKAYAVSHKVEEDIGKYAAAVLLHKYEDTIISKRGKDFKLQGIKVYMHDTHNDFRLWISTLTLTFFCVSKLSKYKTKKLKKLKEDYRCGREIRFDRSNDPVFITMDIDVLTKDLIYQTVELKINNHEIT